VGSADGSSTVVFIVDGDTELPVFVVADPAHPDLELVDALARLALAMRRRGRQVRLRTPHPALCELLELVGLATKLDALPDELSGGERQRVALARALVQGPEMLLCDEPTGQLDSDTGARVLELIEALWREFGFALVVATHDAELGTHLERIVNLVEGRIAGEERQP